MSVASVCTAVKREESAENLKSDFHNFTFELSISGDDSGKMNN